MFKFLQKFIISRPRKITTGTARTRRKAQRRNFNREKRGQQLRQYTFLPVSVSRPRKQYTKPVKSKKDSYDTNQTPPILRPFREY